ncbi:hypothetical protein HELRODRAFT_82517 [Helobdella robusta]|uniref:TLC domain-containing protein n=1 Tax=Helobdella robusta TaxID=6412 RepID=T1G4T1_HELRO|nr:hypothetical protein HELRODRAFT_82517 [Helobdella robusta]ESO00902.1 hypothetical protein HELRODRAFT_82517 [Helobdella robusta]
MAENDGGVYSVYLTVKNIFWSESFWLPSNTTWAVLERTEERFFPSASDLWIPFPLAVFLFFLRLMWERYVALPIGRQYKLRELCQKKPIPNEVLEKLFKKNKKVLPSKEHMKSLMKELDMSEIQIERWWRRRRVQDKPSEMQRFRETSWRFIFYFFAFWGGLITLWDKSWFWDTDHCWYDYPTQHVYPDIWYYYMIEISFYWSLVLSLFMDIRRKDFKEMIVHHIVTISLMAMSYSANFMRIGSLIMCVHDAVDWIMELGKLANYCKYRKTTDLIFVCFTVVWFITRICIYPFYILKSTLFEATKIVGMANIYFVYNGLLCTLQVLHIIWFAMILKMAYYYVIKGQVCGVAVCGFVTVWVGRFCVCARVCVTL